MSNTSHMYEEDLGTTWVWSLNHSIWLYLELGSQPNFSTKYGTSANNKVLWQQHDGGPILPSTSNKWCQTPCICMKRMWGPFHVSLEHQWLHHDFIWCRVFNFSQIQEHETTSSVVKAWWRFNPPIHSIWMMSNILSLYFRYFENSALRNGRFIETVPTYISRYFVPDRPLLRNRIKFIRGVRTPRIEFRPE